MTRELYADCLSILRGELVLKYVDVGLNMADLARTYDFIECVAGAMFLAGIETQRTAH